MIFSCSVKLMINVGTTSMTYVVLTYNCNNLAEDLYFLFSYFLNEVLFMSLLVNLLLLMLANVFLLPLFRKALSF